MDISKVFSRLMVAVLVLSVGLNVALAHRLQAVKSKYNAFIEARAGVRGLHIKTLEVEDPVAGGTSTPIDLSGPTPVVMYVFSPSCGWCAKNLNNIKALSSSLQQQNKARVIGLTLSTEGLKEYMTDSHLDFPVYTRLSDAQKLSLNMGSTPQTLVFANGTVLRDWHGAYSGKMGSEIENVFHVKLPGLVENPAKPHAAIQH